MPRIRSSATTKCISDVPGLAKQVSTPDATSVWTRLSAPFIGSSGIPVSLGSARAAMSARHVDDVDLGIFGEPLVAEFGPDSRGLGAAEGNGWGDRKSPRLNSSH